MARVSLDQFLDQIQNDERSTTVILGAGLARERGRGVPNANGIVNRLRRELSNRGLRSELDRTLDTTALTAQYATALRFAETQAGAWLVDTIIDEAVLAARRPEAPRVFDGDGNPEHWLLPVGLLALAKLLISHPDRFVGVLTMNFDPLLGLAVIAEGGTPSLQFLTPSGALESRGESEGGVPIVHLNGYWREASPHLRHRSAYLDPERPPLDAALVEHFLHGRQVLLMGHYARASPLTHALVELDRDPSAQTQLWVCARGLAPEFDLSKQTLARRRLLGDAHNLLANLADRLNSEHPAQRLVSPTTGIVFAPVSGQGAFMGSSPDVGHVDEHPRHNGQLDDYYIAVTPVTNAQYDDFLASHSKTTKPRYWDNERLNQPNQPVVGLSWEDANDYCLWAGLELPTEAQWEHACRAGAKTRYWSGDDEACLARVGWYKRNSGGRLHPVGEKEANPFGLYDVHGNVWEWCRDSAPEAWDVPDEITPRDGDGLRREPRGDTKRILRGGAWDFDADYARSAYRLRDWPGFRNDDVGFRPVYQADFQQRKLYGRYSRQRDWQALRELFEGSRDMNLKLSYVDLLVQEKDDTEAALRMLASIYEHVQTNTAVNLRIADTLFIEQRFEEAVGMYRWFVEMIRLKDQEANRLFAHSLSRLAFLLVQQEENVDRARSLLTEARTSDPDNHEALQLASSLGGPEPWPPPGLFTREDLRARTRDLWNRESWTANISAPEHE